MHSILLAHLCECTLLFGQSTKRLVQRVHDDGPHDLVPSPRLVDLGLFQQPNEGFFGVSDVGVSTGRNHGSGSDGEKVVLFLELFVLLFLLDRGRRAGSGSTSDSQRLFVVRIVALGKQSSRPVSAIFTCSATQSNDCYETTTHSPASTCSPLALAASTSSFF